MKKSKYLSLFWGKESHNYLQVRVDSTVELSTWVMAPRGQGSKGRIYKENIQDETDLSKRNVVLEREFKLDRR